jgi:hypothetical protein
MDVISANEYWVKAGSLVHTDPTGHDLSLVDDEDGPQDAAAQASSVLK